MSKIELKIDADGVVGIDPAAAAVVNGKQDMGFRKLVVSHVENATTLYAYTEDDSDQVGMAFCIITLISSSCKLISSCTDV